MNLDEFHRSLEEALDWIEENIQDPFFKDDRSWESHPEGSICIGFGDNKRRDILTLNNKVPLARDKKHYESITYMLKEIWNEYYPEIYNLLKIDHEIPPTKFLLDRKVFVEDVSPDSVFSFYILLMRVAGVNGDFPDRNYFRAVNQWELGHTSTPGTLQESWPMLQAALGQMLQENQNIADQTNDVHQRDITRSWISSLRMLNHCISQRYPVHSIAEEDRHPLLHRARNALEIEKQAYQNVLTRSETYQLQLPIKGIPGRKMHIDAIFFTQEISTGIGKRFYRNDTEHTFYKTGFTLDATHRPREKGTGNELTASLDPVFDLDLTNLWIELEKKEQEFYKNNNIVRRKDDPRGDFHLLNLQQENGFTPVNQPWFIYKDKSLIAAPRSIPPDGKGPSNPGTMLEWKDFCDSIWKVYHPAQEIKVLDINPDQPSSCDQIDLEHSRPLITPLDVPEERYTNKQKKNIRLLCFSNLSDISSFILSPTIQRIFAAQITHKDTNIKINNLPLLSSFDFIVIEGGFFVLHDQGALFFNDWNPFQPGIKAIKKELDNAKNRYELIEGIEVGQGIVLEIEHAINRKDNVKKITKLIKKNQHIIGVRKAIQLLRKIILDPSLQRKSNAREVLLTYLNKLKMELETTWRFTEPEPAWSEIRSKLEKRWGLENVIQNLYDSMDKLENTMRTLSEFKTNRLVFLLTFYGFPFLFFGSFFSGILENWTKDPNDRLNFLALFQDIHISGLIVYIGISLGAILLLKVINIIYEKLD